MESMNAFCIFEKIKAFGLLDQGGGVVEERTDGLRTLRAADRQISTRHRPTATATNGSSRTSGVIGACLDGQVHKGWEGFVPLSISGLVWIFCYRVSYIKKLGRPYKGGNNRAPNL